MSARTSQDSCAWFAVEVKPRHERTVAAALETKGIEAFLPLYRARRRWSDRIKEVELPLFPRYVFARFEASKRRNVLTAPGVIRVVGFGDGPLPIPNGEIEAIRAMVRSGLPLSPLEEYLHVGDRVRILQGPLCGLEGILESRRDGSRLVVSVALLMRSVAVEIDRAWVSLAGAQARAATGGIR